MDSNHENHDNNEKDTMMMMMMYPVSEAIKARSRLYFEDEAPQLIF